MSETVRLYRAEVEQFRITAQRAFFHWIEIIAEATYQAAVARWPAAPITLRQGSRVVMKSWTE
jgi:hypothetical protein